MNVNGIFGFLQTEKAQKQFILSIETSVRKWLKGCEQILLLQRIKQMALESNTPLR